MGPIISTVLTFAGGGAFFIAVLLLIYFTQDRAAGAGRFAAMCVRALLPPVKFFLRARRRSKAEHSLNRIIRRGTKDRPFLASKLQLRWQDPRITREEFFEKKRFVVSISKDFDQDAALIDTIYLFVSRSLLVTVKRFLSDDQRAAVDLYFTGRILETASARLSYQFASQYVHDRMSTGAASYMSLFGLLERYALFEDVLVRELNYVGSKVASVASAPLVSSDVDSFMEQLRRLTQRTRGQEMDLVLERQYVRTAIVLAGRAAKIEASVDPYTNYILGTLASKDIDTVYVLSDQSKKARLKELASAVAVGYVHVRTMARDGMLMGQSGKVMVMELRAIHGGILSNAAALGSVEGFAADQSPTLVEARDLSKSVMGTVNYFGDGRGYIRLDDPSFRTDALFFSREVVGSDTLLAKGDRVSCHVVERERGWRAQDVKLIRGFGTPAEKPIEALSLSTSSAVGQENVAMAEAIDVTTEFLTGTLLQDDLADASPDLIILAAEIQSIMHERNQSELALSTLGLMLKRRIPGFSLSDYGYESLMSLIRAVCQIDGTLSMYRAATGHPFVRLIAEE